MLTDIALVVTASPGKRQPTGEPQLVSPIRDRPTISRLMTPPGTLHSPPLCWRCPRIPRTSHRRRCYPARCRPR
jgi:hypothetical protein